MLSRTLSNLKFASAFSAKLNIHDKKSKVITENFYIMLNKYFTVEELEEYVKGFIY